MAKNITLMNDSDTVMEVGALSMTEALESILVESLIPIFVNSVATFVEASISPSLFPSWTTVVTPEILMRPYIEKLANIAADILRAHLQADGKKLTAAIDAGALATAKLVDQCVDELLEKLNSARIDSEYLKARSQTYKKRLEQLGHKNLWKEFSPSLAGASGPLVWKQTARGRALIYDLRSELVGETPLFDSPIRLAQAVAAINAYLAPSAKTPSSAVGRFLGEILGMDRDNAALNAMIRGSLREAGSKRKGKRGANTRFLALALDDSRNAASNARRLLSMRNMEELIHQANRLDNNLKISKVSKNEDGDLVIEFYHRPAKTMQYRAIERAFQRMLSGRH